MIRIWDYFELGGFMMWPLLVCSILLGAVLIERVIVVGLWGVVFKRPLTKRVWWGHGHILRFFEEVPPGLGLLGTIIGIVQSFHLADGQVAGSEVGAGLAVACMTTIFGLSIAIVATVVRYMLDAAANRAIHFGQVKA
ncbi:flagellar motor protein PomA [Poriferisphaera corsica]|uniref:Flagellar motor protein PomA n=1 Tax=Poriferisphaera corsica TaxID=2528020 RepID=A0A517YPA1_9BACT|nr:MotA/TolQ/ExbB proton channel family protein [Poriferisphaera corsica]QDU32036.1 flagellar motor protein PomA [Poriferisphaera corsica]